MKKYWFVSYNFVGENNTVGFGNCWVLNNSGILSIAETQKWVIEREKFKSCRILYFSEISKEQYYLGIEQLEK